MDTVLLGSVSGVLLSLVFSYVPGLSEWFGALAAKNKQAVMGGLLILVALGAFGLSCAGVDASFACTKDGAIASVKVLISALVANQSTYTITK